MPGKDFFTYRTRQPDPRSPGVCNVYRVRCEAIGKGNHSNHDYVISNEWIAGRIAQWLNLPIPPFILMGKKTGKTRMFGSYSFEKKQMPCDIIAAVCVKKMPHLCTGILLFDILIANNDRHRGNIKVDSKLDPKAIHIFDHDRCLFGCTPGKGKQRLEEIAPHIGVGAGPASGGNKHVFLPFEHSVECLSDWCNRIRQIPDNYLRDVCDETASMGTKKSERKAVFEFLRDRSTNLGTLLVSHKSSFIGSEKWDVMFL